MRINEDTVQGIRSKLDAFYDGTCTVTGFERLPGVIDRVQEVTLGENLPCHLDYAQVYAGAQSDTTMAIRQEVTLLLAPEPEVLPGSRVQVTQNGISRVYEAAGAAAVYATHQEVPLKLVNERA